MISKKDIKRALEANAEELGEIKDQIRDLQVLELQQKIEILSQQLILQERVLTVSLGDNHLYHQYVKSGIKVNLK